ncbi:MAG: alanine dehydrogenase [bacterium]|nr:alanine dehydrogenase [bacterium]
MIIAVPKEIKEKEFRAGIVPAGVKALTSSGHAILIEKGAGLGSGIDDSEYIAAGASIVNTAEELYGVAEMIMKVKEPLPEEYPFLREGLIIYTYLHLAPLPELTDILLKKKVTGIGYETVKLESGYLPLLAPMSMVAGRMSVQAGAHFLEKEEGGRGILLSGMPGVEKGHVSIIGGGIVGTNAARIASAMGADVTLLDKDVERLASIDTLFEGRIKTLMSNSHNIEEELKAADLVIGAVLIPGARAPKLVTKDMLSLMKKGAVIVDVAIDQGGCFQTSRPTTHSDPVFYVDGITHYCVANMPGAVPRTSTFALTNATLPIALEIANKGLKRAATDSAAIMSGINTFGGRLTNLQVAKAQDKKWEVPCL